jgi:hypothetical protein
MWCQLFDEDSLLMMEYGEDLENYYEKSFGTPLGYEISFLLLNDFFSAFDVENYLDFSVLKIFFSEFSVRK